MKPKVSGKLALAISLTFPLCAPYISLAQSTTSSQNSATGTAAGSEEVIELNPFLVDASSSDVGYTAMDSLAGGRANLPLRITAAPISSITRTFIDDVQVTNVKDILRWTAGAVPQNWRGGKSGSGSQFNAWAFSIRGQGGLDQGGNPPTRNYFPNYVVQDLYNVDRVEASRGPNSILFGVGDIGGAIATYTKIPRLDRSKEEGVLTVNSEGGVRFTADVNRPVSKSVAVRINALAERERGWRDGDKATTYAIDVSTLYKVSEKTQVRLELEGYRKKNSIYAFSLQDTKSLWNGTTSAAAWGDTIADSDRNPLTTPGAPGVKNMTAWGPTTLVWIPGLRSEGIMNWRDGYRTIGTNDVGWGGYLRPDEYTFGPTGTVIPSLPSKEFTVAAGDGYIDSRYYSATLWLDQKINENMEFQLSAYNYADSPKSQNYENPGANGAQSSIDLNRQLPNGQPNPNFGKTYSDFFLNAQNQFHPATEFRGQFNYHFDADLFGKPLRQWFSVSAGYRKTQLKPRTYLAFDVPTIGADNWIEHMVWGRLYWDDPRASMNVPDNIHYLAMPFNWFDFNLEEKIKYAGVVSQTRLLDDRVNITFGARRDKYSNHKVGIRGTDNPPTTVDESGNTYQAGVVGYITHWLGLNYNYSENFAPVGGGVAPSLYGAPHGAASGKGQTVGLRISTNDGKYYATANYYEDKSKDRPRGGPGFQGIWNRYLDAGGTERDIGPAGVITGSGISANVSMSFSDTTDLESHGFEFELTANPIPSLRLQVNLSIPRAELSNSIPDSRRYYAEHIADWEATANEPSSDPAVQLERDGLKTALVNLKNEIDSLSLPVINGHLIKSTFSFFGNYTFLGEKLRGFSIGGGGYILGKQYGNPWDNVNGGRILSPGYSVFNVVLGYRKTLTLMGREVDGKFQLNVDNVLDNDKLIFRSYQGYGTGLTQAMDYDFIDPRKYTLSATFSF
ncbi:MAG TPA: TonB-dependent receptor plug domain-containing protein [Opitutaceae bacterium]